MNDDLLHFNDVRVTRSDLVAAAMGFVGLPYNEGTNLAFREPGERWQGYANCFGVLLLAARECGLLHPELPLDLAPATFGGQAVAKTLLKIMEYNFDEVSFSATGRGDILMLRYRDVNPQLNEPHHVAMLVHDNPLRLLHASQTVRRTYVCSFDELYRLRTERILKCRNIVEG